MELRVLGPMEAVLGTGTVDLGTRKQRAVLSLLLMDLDRVVSVDRLVDCLWGDEPPPTASNALQVYISALRKILEPDRGPGVASRLLLTQAPGYVLRMPPHAVDASRFEAMVAEGQALLSAGRPAPAYDVLTLGVNLWRGPAYQDLEFERFVQAEVARLNDLRDTAADARAEALLALGRQGEAVVELERLVIEDPLSERRWALLALALYRDGRQGNALRALSRARQTLGEELGLDPGPELRRLEHDILDQAARLDWRPPAEQPPTPVRRVPLRHANGGGMYALFPEIAPAGRRRSRRSAVVPADGRPKGMSLTDMAASVARFTLSGNDPKLYPETPFQVLFASDVDVEMVAGGVVASGRNMFTVTAGTEFFVPVFILDDALPVVPGFPSACSEAASYVFDPATCGARDFEIVIDGVATAIGPEYLVGPIPAGDTGIHVLTLGAFLGPLTLGPHTVVIRGGVFGRAHAETFGIAFIQEEFTYLVEVVPESGCPPGR